MVVFLCNRINKDYNAAQTNYNLQQTYRFYGLPLEMIAYFPFISYNHHLETDVRFSR